MKNKILDIFLNWGIILFLSAIVTFITLETSNSSTDYTDLNFWKLVFINIFIGKTAQLSIIKVAFEKARKQEPEYIIMVQGINDISKQIIKDVKTEQLDKYIIKYNEHELISLKVEKLGLLINFSKLSDKNIEKYKELQKRYVSGDTECLSVLKIKYEYVKKGDILNASAVILNNSNSTKLKGEQYFSKGTVTSILPTIIISLLIASIGVFEVNKENIILLLSRLFLMSIAIFQGFIRAEKLVKEHEIPVLKNKLTILMNFSQSK